MTVNLIPPGDDYLDRWTQLDLSLRKLFRVHGMRIDGALEIFNTAQQQCRSLAEPELRLDARPAAGSAAGTPASAIDAAQVLRRFAFRCRAILAIRLGSLGLCTVGEGHLHHGGHLLRQQSHRRLACETGEFTRLNQRLGAQRGVERFHPQCHGLRAHDIAWSDDIRHG